MHSINNWRVCHLPCLTDDVEATSPSEFIHDNHIVIRTDNDQSSEPKYSVVDDVTYAMEYLKCCAVVSTDYGWGLFANRIIPADTPLITYTGELISNEETSQRQAYYDKKVIHAYCVW